MNKMTAFLVLLITVLSFCLGATLQGHALATKGGFEGIMPFVTSNDRVGFMDQANGRIYLYDGNLTNCIFVGQIDSLGKPINVINANSPESLSR